MLIDFFFTDSLPTKMLIIPFFSQDESFDCDNTCVTTPAHTREELRIINLGVASWYTKLKEVSISNNSGVTSTKIEETFLQKKVRPLQKLPSKISDTTASNPLDQQIKTVNNMNLPK